MSDYKGLFRSVEGNAWHWTEDGHTAICNPRIIMYERAYPDFDCSKTDFCCKTCLKKREGEGKMQTCNSLDYHYKKGFFCKLGHNAKAERCHREDSDCKDYGRRFLGGEQQ
jgi:hypothetical protein